jgi:hypothetical protein
LCTAAISVGSRIRSSSWPPRLAEAEDWAGNLNLGAGGAFLKFKNKNKIIFLFGIFNMDLFDNYTILYEYSIYHPVMPPTDS